jgi:hypothetical protein
VFYYGGGQRGWLPRRVTCADAKMASLHLIAPVISLGNGTSTSSGAALAVRALIATPGSGRG